MLDGSDVTLPARPGHRVPLAHQESVARVQRGPGSLSAAVVGGESLRYVKMRLLPRLFTSNRSLPLRRPGSTRLRM